jgi:hypothetical protein
LEVARARTMGEETVRRRVGRGIVFSEFANQSF